VTDLADRLAELSPEKRQLLETMLAKRAAGLARPASAPSRRAGSRFPLSLAQERLWFLDQLEPDTSTYNLPVLLRLSGRLDRAALAASLTEIVRRHEALRTRFEDGEQVVAPAGDFPLPLLDLAALPAGRRGAVADRLSEDEVHRPFDLRRGPPLRVLLLRLAADEHRAVATMHHIVSDGWSFAVFVREIGQLYAAFARRQPSPLSPLPWQYGDFAVWQRRHLGERGLAEQLAYWRRALAGLPPLLELPADRQRPPARSHAGQGLVATLPGRLARPLRDAARRAGTTLFGGLLATFLALLHRYTGRDDLALGSPIAGRRLVETERLIGFFVNTLVLRVGYGGRPCLRECLGRVREVVLEAQAHQDLPFDRLVAELAPQRTLAHAPLVQVLFALQNAPRQALALPGLALAELPVRSSVAQFDLELALTEAGEAVTASWIYATDLFDAPTAARLAGHFEALLQAALAEPERPLDELPLLGEGERHAVLAGWNDTAAAYPRACLHELFERWAARTPAAPAAVFGGEVLTYGELDRRAGRLARRLVELGVGPDERVGLLAGRSPAMVVGMLAVLKAGGAHVPLDPAYPRERLSCLLADSRPAVLLAEPRFADLLPDPGMPVVALATETLGGDDVASGPACKAREHPETGAYTAAQPESLAYVIYTSGSTGRPKGVAVTHRAVCRLVLGGGILPLGPDDRIAQTSSVSFDAATLEIWGALLCGGCLVGFATAEVLSPPELAAAVAAQEITVLLLTAAWFHRVAWEAPGSLARLRGLIPGGEAVDPRAFAAVLAAGPPERLIYGYGPTESTTLAATHRVRRVPPGVATLPIGRAIGNTRLLVLDPQLEPAPLGVEGDLYVGGDGLARGYLGGPDLTAGRFVPDPYGEPGERLYATGDRARWLARGEVEFLGRRDGQLKIRGFRIEPGEVEAALGEHPGVAEAAVVAQDEETGGKRLVAFVVARDGASPGTLPAELRSTLQAKLPAHLVPAAIAVVDSLPLTPNGKLDRRELARRPVTPLAARPAATAPRTPTEELLAGLWAEVLGLERVGRDESFFDLGGHSLLATRLISRVRKALAMDVPLRVLFEAPTVAGLAARLPSLRADSAGPIPPLAPVPRTAPLPLSFAQQRLWFLDRLQPGSTAYNIPLAVRLTGPLAAAALERTLAEVVRRHEALRTTFAAGAEPVQLVHPAASFSLPRVDLSALPLPVRSEEADRLVAADARRPFDLERGPLFRPALLRLGAEEHRVLATMHHIVSDGWSLEVFVREVAALYPSFAAGRPSPLPELPVQYADFASWQRRWLAGEMLAAETAHWRRRLAGAPAVLELPADRPRPAEWSGRGAHRSSAFPLPLAAALHALARREAVTPFMLLLAAFQALLARWSNQRDVCVGTPIAGRGRLENEGLIGFFVNTLVMRSHLADDPSGHDALARTREVALDAYAHQDLPFEKLVEELAPERSRAHSPLFQAMFALQNAMPQALELPGLALAALPVASATTKFDLSLTLFQAVDGALAGSLTYAADLFDSATILRLLASYETLLTHLANDPGRRLSDLALLTPPERHHLLAEWNDTAFPSHPALCLHDLLTLQARRAPLSPALLFAGQTFTYLHLDRWSDRIAHRLRRAGARPGTIVGLLFDRSPALVAALLGVLKSGAAYLALDPDQPSARHRQLLADAGSPILLTAVPRRPVGLERRRRSGALGPEHPNRPEAESETRSTPTSFVGTPEGRDSEPPEGEAGQAAGQPPPLSGFRGCTLRVEATYLEEGDEAPLPPLAGPADAAYVVYTSGSTGRPKGILAHHRGAVIYLTWVLRHYGLTAADTALQLAPATFDASVRDVLAPLAAGARLLLVPRDAVRDPEVLLARIAEHGVTCLPSAVPSLLRLLAEAAHRQNQVYSTVRLVLAAGERLYPSDAAAVRSAFGPRARLFNQYGASEATMSTTYEEVGVREEASVAVGRPLAGARARLLDRFLGLLPAGAAGEIALGGPGLTYGYLGQPERTAEAFVPDPYSHVPGARLYRTGDLGRYLADGRLEYLGRLDQQVKLRGMRVEPGEVEAALASHPAVRQAAVLARPERDGEVRLAAYVVMRDSPASDPLSATAVGQRRSSNPPEEALSAFLRERLPEWMVPAGWAFLTELPLTAHGKVDREALAGIEPERGSGGEQVAPRTALEKQVAAVWGEVLGLERVGAHDNFFALGGHSLLAMRLVMCLRDRLGAEVAVGKVFAEPTVAGLAAAVERARLQGEEVPSRPRPAAAEGPAPLSFHQLRLWFLDQLEPGSAAYTIARALELLGPLDPAALQGALDLLVARHAALRTTFSPGSGDGEPVQVVASALSLPLPVLDLGALPAAQAAAEAERLADGEAIRPFDLRRGPLLRLALARLGTAEHRLFLAIHHIVSDGWSMEVLVREMAAAYAALAHGERPQLDPLPLQYIDFARWQRRWLQGETLERELAYWRGQLGGLPPLLELPADRPRPPVFSYRGGNAPLALTAEHAAGLRRTARRHGATPFAALLAAFAALLLRWSGREELVVGLPIVYRNWPEVEGLIGFFANTLVLPSRLAGDPAFSDLLAATRERVADLFAHQDLPFEKLVEELAPERSLAHSPIFQVAFSLLNTPRARIEARELRLRALPARTESAKFDLTLALEEDGDGLAGAFEYARDLFDPTTIARLAGHFEAVLAGATAAPERRLSELPLLSRAESHQLLAEWNDSAVEEEPIAVHWRVLAQAARTPRSPAVLGHPRPSLPFPPSRGEGDAPSRRFAEETLTYGELARRATALAARLAALDLGAEARVGICAERSADLLVGMRAALAAGVAYVPLDPSYPGERLAYLAGDAGLAALLAQERLRGRVPLQGLPVVLLDDLEGEPAAPAPLPAVDPDAAAYVLYTSGSTGQPKGVVVTHRSLANAFRGWETAYRLREEPPVLLQTASFSFDVFVADALSALGSGGTLVLCPPELQGDPAALLALMREQGVTAASLVPAVTALLARHLEETGGGLDFLRLLIVGSDAWRADEFVHVARLCGPGTRLLNVYGVTEATVDTTWFAGRALPAGGGAPVPIGRPFANARVYLLDRRLGAVALGAAGELAIAGPGVARGYLRRPELTAERFVPDPFAGRPGERLYRTGDLARRLADGTLQFLGRIDQQVKVRGVRIEPGEVETALAAHPAVAQAAVAAARGGLVAFVVSRGTVDGDLDAVLRPFLRERLPEPLVPATFVALAALPLTANGKVDRGALARLAPAGGIGATGAASAAAAPRTPVEEIVAAAWSEVLGVERVGPADNFFALGGHSLLATRVVSRVREALGVELPLRRLFDTPDLAGLAAAVEAARRAGEELPAPPIRPVDRGRELPLSFAQERLWFLERLRPGTAAYHLPAALYLRGRLDAGALGRALSALARRHEPLRTRFAASDGRPAQRILPAEPVPFPCLDLAALPADRRETAAAALATAEALRPFDLAADAPLRAALLRLGEREHALLLTLHHIAVDAWSIEILTRELAALYAAHAADTADTADTAGRPSLAELPVQYADYAAWQRQWLAGEALERQLAWWRRRLAGAPVLDLPADRPRTASAGTRGAARPLALAEPVAAALRALARSRGATPFMALLAGFAALLGRHAGQADIVVGSPVAGRTRAEVEGLVGFFVNMLALRVDLAGEPPEKGASGFGALLARVREAALGAYDHQDLPFEKLVEELRPERHLGRNPLFQVSFQLLVIPAPVVLPGIEVAPLPLAAAPPKFDLALTLSEEPGGTIAGALQYDAGLYDATTIERLLGHFERLLGAAAADPALPVDDLPLLAAGEQHQLVAEWNDTRAVEPWPGRPVDAWIAAIAAERPTAAALVHGEVEVSYGEMERRAGRLARRLAALGAGPERVVAICLEPSPALVVAMLAVWKAGAAYLPLDPAYPPERLAFLLADAGARALVGRADLLAGLPPHPAPWQPVDDGGNVLEEGEEAPLPARNAAALDGLAYVIYTSGSTGTPKGVAVTHRGLGNLAAAERQTFGLGPGDRALLFASFSFDASLYDLLAALGSGAAVVLAGKAERMPGPDLVRLLERQRVTWAVTTPSALAALPYTELPELRILGVGSEACPAELVARWAPGRRFFNLYGPTEITVVAVTAECAPAAAPPPIGRPIANTRGQVLDPRLRPVPVGVAGELLLAGPGLARGYLGRPELTAERFVPDPWGSPGGRLYRTGDRVRARPDGRLDFLGRLDEQVKVRGFRIEPGEIEAALIACPGVREAAVVVREERPGDRRLVAYVVGEPELSARTLREAFGRRLPEHLVPSAFAFVPALPLTPSRKLDRRALARIAPGRQEEGYVAPRTPVEEVLAGIWSEVLGVERVGAEDDFFALSGHSLLATQVVSRVREALGVELPLRRLFERATLAELALEVEALRGAGGAGSGAGAARAIVPVPRDRPLPASFYQDFVWRLDDGGLSQNSIPFALSVRGPLDVTALSRSLDEVVRRHESLRTTFRGEGGEVYLAIASPGAVPLPVVDLAAVPEELQAGLVLRLASGHAGHGFDLARGPLFIAELLRLGRQEHVLLLNVHHGVADGWSYRVLLHDLTLLYGAFSRGEPSPLPELPIQFTDFAWWQRHTFAAHDLAAQLAWWRRRLAGRPGPPELPIDLPRPATVGPRGVAVDRLLPRPMLEMLRALARTAGASLSMALYAGVFALLHRYSGEEDLIVDSIFAGRNRPELAGLIGLVMNTVPVRVDLSRRPSFRELLLRVRDAVLAAYEHQDVPFPRLLAELFPGRQLSRTLLSGVTFNMLSFPTPAVQTEAAGSGLGLETFSAVEEVAKQDLSFTLSETGAGVHCHLRGAADLFLPASVAAIARDYEELLTRAARDPGAPIDDLLPAPHHQAAECEERRGAPV
jgi:amino acid adenylation domain-containing protein